MALENFEVWFQKLQFGGKEQQAFLEDMATLVADGVSTRDAIDAIQQISKGAKQLAAAEVASAISRGAGLAEGMSGWFNPSIVEIIRAGETSGTLTETLKAAADSLAKTAGSVGDLIAALVYPLVVMCGAIGMMVFVRDSVFDSFKQIKPVSVWPDIAQTLYHLGGFFQHYWWVVIVVLVSLIVGLSKMLANLTGPARERIDRIPILCLYRESLAARCLSTLGMLLENGVSFNKALKILQSNVNPYFAWHLMMMELKLSAGQENIADVLDTGLLNQEDFVRLRLVSKGSGFEAALKSLGNKASVSTAAKIRKLGKIAGGVVLGLGAGIAASMVFAIYNVGSIIAT